MDPSKSKRKHLTLAGLVAVGALLLGACGDDGGTAGPGDGETTTTEPGVGPDGGGGDLSAAQADLDEARERWEAAGLSGYTLTYQPTCFCPQARWTVIVEDGEVADSSVEGDAMQGPPMTVADMFDAIQQAIDDGVATVSAEYDADLGHPVSYYVDVDQMMADEEYGVTVRSLEPAGGAAG